MNPAMNTFEGLLATTLQSLRQSGLQFVRVPFDAGNHLFWLYLVSSVILAVISYGLYQRQDGFSPRKIFGYFFPKSVYFHPSARVDYQLFVANQFVVPLVGIAISGLTAVIASSVGRFMVQTFGVTENPLPSGMPTLVAVTLVTAMVSDFRTYVVHLVHHHVPLLWEFHRVHHTAEVLTPITLFRKHPFYDTIGNLLFEPIYAVLQGVTLYFFFGEFSVATLFGVNAVYSLFRLFGANLRHTHIWLSWGPVLSRIFISPAQHQIHHSVDPKHTDKNMGEVFAFWDWIFGTIYIPKEREELVYGIVGSPPQEHPTLLAAYLVPLRNSERMTAGWFKPAAARKAVPARSRNRSNRKKKPRRKRRRR
jgi:sterol desaturase/sphingolipid hydroxylase (fatty acid hydroxylase superfamily)